MRSNRKLVVVNSIALGIECDARNNPVLPEPGHHWKQGRGEDQCVVQEHGILPAMPVRVEAVYDDDGNCTMPEAVEAVKACFGDMDANGDGVLDNREMYGVQSGSTCGSFV